MAITAECAFCGKEIKVKEALAGRKVKCPDCGGQVQVAGGDDDDEELLEERSSRRRAGGEDEDSGRPSRRKPRKKSGTNPAVIVGILAAAGALLLMCVLAGAITFFRRNADPAAAKPPDAQPGRGFNKPEAPVVVQAKNWSARNDPPVQGAAPLNFANAELPGGDVFEDAVFGPYGCPIVAVGGNGIPSERRTFLNAATGAQLGELTGKQLDRTHRAITSDGKYFAGKVLLTDDLLVWDIANSKELGSLKLPGKFPKWIGFGGSIRVLALVDKTLSSWKLPSGELERSIQVEAWDDKGVAVSPGGKYVVCVNHIGTNKSIKLHDLETGALAGEIPVPDHYYDMRGVGFAPDGSELAAMFSKSDDILLLAWNMSTGQTSASINLKKQDGFSDSWHGYNGRQVVWFPNKRYWLLCGEVVASRDSKSAVWSLSTSELGSGRNVQVLDDTHLLVGSRGGVRKSKVSVVEVTKEKLEQAARIVAAGGTSADADLPPLTKSNLGPARLVTIGGGGGWQVKPDPAPAAKSKLLAESMLLKVRAVDLRTGGFSAAAAARFVAQYSRVTTPGALPQGNANADDAPRTPTFLDVYDLATGELTGTVGVPFDSSLADVSPDGKRVLMLLGGKQDRIDVLEADGGKPVCAWRPYQEEETKKIGIALFIDDNHVLTMSGTAARGLVVVWEIPSCRAVYKLTDVRYPGVSRNGKYVVVANQDTYQFFEALTGQPAGKVVLPGAPTACSFYPDGELFGALVDDGGSSRLMVWKVADGSLQHEVPLAFHSHSLKLTDTSHALVGGALYHIPSKSLVWRYQDPVRHTQVVKAPDNRHWYVAGQAAGGALRLNAVDVPHAEAAQAIAEANLKPDYVIEPGKTVSLVVNMTSPDAKPKMAADVTGNLTTRLQQNGAIVQPGSDLVLTVQMGNPVVGKTMELTNFGAVGAGGKTSVPELKVTWSMTITRGGQKVWSRTGEADNGFFGITSVPPNKPVAQHLSEMMYDRIMSRITGEALPRFLLSEDSAKGLGRSWFTSDGIQQMSN